MALKDTWKDLQDATEGVAGSGDDISVKPINVIAHAVIKNENDIEGKQDKAFVFDVTLDEDLNVNTEATKEQITSAYEQGKEVIARVAYSGRTYIAPLTHCEIDKSFVSFVFDIYVDSGHIQLMLETVFDTGIEYSYYWQINYIEVAKQSDIDGKADKTERFVFRGISHIELSDNYDFTIDDVSNLTITYPDGNFICSLTLTTASEGIIDIRLPDSSKFIGEAPTFKNGENWELSIKNGVVVGGVVK